MNLMLIAEALQRADSELSAWAAHRPIDKREAQEVSDLCRRALKELPSLRERLAAKDAAPDPAAERLLDALANNGCGLPYPEMLALVRAYREQVREECAKVCDEVRAAANKRADEFDENGVYWNAKKSEAVGARDCARALRSASQEGGAGE